MNHVDKPLHERIIDWARETEEREYKGNPFGIVTNESEEWYAMYRCQGGDRYSLMAADQGGYAVLTLLMIAAIAAADDLP